MKMPENSNLTCSETSFKNKIPVFINEEEMQDVLLAVPSKSINLYP